MFNIIKSKKQAFKEMSEALMRHHSGKLPKNYYAPDGHIYGKAFFSKMSQKDCSLLNRKKEREIKEKEKEIIKNFKKRPIVRDSEILNR